MGFFLGLGVHYKRVRVQLIGFGLVVAGVLHGLYDHWAAEWAGAALAALIVLTFVGYARSGDQIGDRLEQHFVTTGV